MFCTCSRICSISHLHLHRDVGQLQRGGLRAQRVGLAVQFLDQEVQPLAEFAAGLQQALDLVEVRAPGGPAPRPRRCGWRRRRPRSARAPAAPRRMVWRRRRCPAPRASAPESAAAGAAPPAAPAARPARPVRAGAARAPSAWPPGARLRARAPRAGRRCSGAPPPARLRPAARPGCRRRGTIAAPRCTDRPRACGSQPWTW
jgi:hypothetical protein